MTVSITMQIGWTTGIVPIVIFFVGTFASGNYSAPRSCVVHIDCNNGSKADSIPYSRCLDGGCACVQGYYQLNHSSPCTPIKIGTPCQDQEDPDGFCESGIQYMICGQAGFCECAEGYHVDVNNWGQDFCKHYDIGSPCTTDEDCLTGMEGSSCVSGECRCPPGEVFVGSLGSCEHHVIDSICDVCHDSGGLCYDLDKDDIPEACECPTFKRSDNSTDLAIGCNIGLVDPGKLCDPDGKVSICRSQNAECVHLAKISRYHHCKCGLTYVAVPDRRNPDYLADCAKAISQFADPNCMWCDDRAGICVDKDGDYLRDTCICPATKTTSNPDHPSNDCDTEHVNVTCQRDAMVITYTPHDSMQFRNLSSDLKESGKVFVRGMEKFGRCWFQKEGSDYSLRLPLSEKMLKMCNVLKFTSPDESVTYTTEIVVQRSKQLLLAWNDFVFGAYCTYVGFADTGTGGVRLNTKIIGQELGTEGTAVHSALELTAYDVFGRNAEDVGLSRNGELQLEVKMTDDGGAYKCLKVDTCLASDRPNLKDPRAQTQLLVIDGCPLGVAETEFKLDPSDPKRALSSYFKSVSFDDSDFVYYHCSVKVCRQPSECPEPDCAGTATGRKRRSIEKRAAVNYDHFSRDVEFNWGVQSGIRSGGINFVGNENPFGQRGVPGAFIEEVDDGEHGEDECEGVFGICGFTVTYMSLAVTSGAVILSLAVVGILIMRKRNSRTDLADPDLQELQGSLYTSMCSQGSANAAFGWQ